MKNGKMVKMGWGAICLAALLVAAKPASGATYSLNSYNPGIASYTGPFGSVGVSLTDSSDALITFTASSVGAYHYLFGDGGSIALNVNGAVTILGGAFDSHGNITSGLSGITQPQGVAVTLKTPTYSMGTGNEDGFGPFNFELDNIDGFQAAVGSISFTLHRTTGTWASDTSVLTANADGWFTAAHIFVANSDYSNTGATGYAANDGTSTSHELLPDGGSTVALLGFGLLGIATLRQRLSRK
jgi:hypothetical protein